MDTLLIIDGSSLLSTHYYGNLPPEVLMAKTDEEKEANYFKILQTSYGVYTNGVYGMLKIILYIIEQYKPSHMAICFDVSRNTTFRKKMYSQYKGNRKATPSPLKEQFILAQTIFSNMGITVLADEKFEADDLVGSLAKKFSEDIPVTLLTKDRDYYQLVDKNSTLWLMQTKWEKQQGLLDKYNILGEFPEKSVPFDVDRVFEETGVYPEQIPDLKGLQGDASDNIPGVKNLCSLAPMLLNLHSTIEGIYEFIDSHDKKYVIDYWKSYGAKRTPYNPLMAEGARDIAYLSKALARIKTDIPLDLSLENLKTKIDKDNFIKICSKLEFKSLIDNI